MPIFEYSCQDCGTKFEKLIRNSDTNAPVCPSCGEQHLQKELSTFSARANGMSDPAPMGGGCGAGMCRTPNICGRN